MPHSPSPSEHAALKEEAAQLRRDLEEAQKGQANAERKLKEAREEAALKEAIQTGEMKYMAFLKRKYQELCAEMEA